MANANFIKLKVGDIVKIDYVQGSRNFKVTKVSYVNDIFGGMVQEISIEGPVISGFVYTTNDRIIDLYYEE